MCNNDLTNRHLELLHMMHELPKHMAGVHERHNSAEFVLHHLCQQQHFNVVKAAYFVDNPDFQCMKGVVGFSHDQEFQELHWNSPHEFTVFMTESPFNKQVRSILREGLAKQGGAETAVTALAQELGIENPCWCSWNLRHDNYGYLVYQKPDNHDPLTNNFFTNSLHILSFCPVF